MYMYPRTRMLARSQAPHTLTDISFFVGITPLSGIEPPAQHSKISKSRAHYRSRPRNRNHLRGIRNFQNQGHTTEVGLEIGGH
jgi:hypothetical protein